MPFKLTKMTKRITLLLFFLGIAIISYTQEIGISILGGMPMNSSVQKSVPFSHAFEFGYYKKEKNRLDATGFVIGYYNYMLKSGKTYKPINDSLETVQKLSTIYAETGFKYYITNNFSAGLEFGAFILYRQSDGKMQKEITKNDIFYSVIPSLYYSVGNRITFFEKLKLCNSAKLSTINIGLTLKLF